MITRKEKEVFEHIKYLAKTILEYPNGYSAAHTMEAIKTAIANNEQIEKAWKERGES